jgi:SNF2 family DNA or RNA helicase
MAKVEPLAEEIKFALQNNLLTQTVVFGFHVNPLVELAKRLADSGISAAVMNGATGQIARIAMQEDFRHNRISVLVCNIIAAGTAIDLSAASHAYFLELDWVPGNNVQAANRLISMDKQEPVTADVVTWPGSADDKVQQVLVRRARELAQLY